MTFFDIEFFFFLPLLFVAYWLLPRRANLQNALLLVASWIFYYSWSPRLFWVLLVSTAVDYLIALDIDKHRGRAKIALAISVIYNLGQLGFFKYSGFFAVSFNRMMSTVGLGAPLPVLNFLLPLGISFYTFTKLSYVIDVYYDRIKPCRSPLTFATFVAFFPQLTAGPIVRAGELLPHYESPRRFDVDRLRSGAGIFFFGFVKKAFVADWLGQFIVKPVFANHELFSTSGHWIGLAAYALQVYCDFSGYSEMAIGVGRLFGIELPANFRYPFLASGMIDFWRRWHITLNQWLFDYIYGPLTTGTGFMRGRLQLGFLVVFLASGLWHGAKMTFILWGALHGFALVAQHRWDLYYRNLCRQDRKWVARRKSLAYQTGAWLLTQFFFLLTLIPFRSSSVAESAEYLRALFVPTAGARLPSMPMAFWKLGLFASVGFVVADHLLERASALREKFFALPAPVRGVAYGLVIAFLLVFMPASAGTFIYAAF